MAVIISHSVYRPHYYADTAVELPGGAGLGCTGYAVDTDKVYAKKVAGWTEIGAGGGISLSADADANLLSLAASVLGLDNQSANKIFAGPVSGAAVAPTFRTPVTADISGLVYGDRGDISAWDFNRADFTCDGLDHTLNTAALIPIGAKAVLVLCVVKDTLATRYMTFFKNGYTGGYNVIQAVTFVANISTTAQGLIACDADRKIAYNGTIQVGQTCSMSIVGWLF